jgi:hypothetical protein
VKQETRHNITADLHLETIILSLQHKRPQRVISLRSICCELPDLGLQHIIHVLAVAMKTAVVQFDEWALLLFVPLCAG